jgi:hypothetical protein
MGVGSMLLIVRKLAEEHPVSETEDARMGSSPQLTRRRLLTAAAAVPALKLQSAHAQTTADPGCTIGFLHGLLQYSQDCSLLSPPALGAEVAPPSHLVSLAQAADGATGDTSGDKVPQSGSRRKRAKQRQHHRHKLTMNRRHQRRKTNRAARHRRFRRHH